LSASVGGDQGVRRVHLWRIGDADCLKVRPEGLADLEALAWDAPGNQPAASTSSPIRATSSSTKSPGLVISSARTWLSSAASERQ
jgi:hypothetical protein